MLLTILKGASVMMFTLACCIDTELTDPFMVVTWWMATGAVIGITWGMSEDSWTR